MIWLTGSLKFLFQAALNQAVFPYAPGYNPPDAFTLDVWVRAAAQVQLNSKHSTPGTEPKTHISSVGSVDEKEREHSLFRDKGSY
jgi:hypothetical protein